MAAFANNRGGFIVFGVEASPHRLKGVNSNRFNELDPAQVTTFLRDHLSPEIEWDLGVIEFHGVELGYLYTFEAAEKPVIATRTSGAELKDGEIYYRYKAQSTQVRFGELRRIVEARLAREREAWMHHLQAISRAGPLNVGILDTLEGQIHSGGPPFLIDEDLVRKLRFVRRGKFAESTGKPTLRLIGDLQAISGPVKQRTIQVGIHFEDLVSAFLAQRHLTPEESRSYLEETAFQVSHLVPIFYFLDRSGLSIGEAVDLIKSAKTSFSGIRSRLVRRLEGGEIILPQGAVIDYDGPVGETKEDLLRLFQESGSAKDKRSLLLRALVVSPDVVQQALPELPVARVCEVVTHVEPDTIRTHREPLFRLLLHVLNERFASLTSSEKTTFRKAVAFLDERLRSVESLSVPVPGEVD